MAVKRAGVLRSSPDDKDEEDALATDYAFVTALNQGSQDKLESFIDINNCDKDFKIEMDKCEILLEVQSNLRNLNEKKSEKIFLVENVDQSS